MNPASPSNGSKPEGAPAKRQRLRPAADHERDLRAGSQALARLRLLREHPAGLAALLRDLADGAVRPLECGLGALERLALELRDNAGRRLGLHQRGLAASRRLRLLYGAARLLLVAGRTVAGG